MMRESHGLQLKQPPSGNSQIGGVQTGAFLTVRGAVLCVAVCIGPSLIARGGESAHSRAPHGQSVQSTNGVLSVVANTPEGDFGTGADLFRGVVKEGWPYSSLRVGRKPLFWVHQPRYCSLWEMDTAWAAGDILGHGWQIDLGFHRLRATQDDHVELLSNFHGKRLFLPNAQGRYDAAGSRDGTLTHDVEMRKYTLTEDGGKRIYIYADSSSSWGGKKGLLLEKADANGNRLVFTYDGSSPGARIDRIAAYRSGAGRPVETLVYNYGATRSNKVRLNSLMLKPGFGKRVGGAVYVYHDDSSYSGDCGTAGDLIMVLKCWDTVGVGTPTSTDGTSPKSMLNDAGAAYTDDALIGYKLVMADGKNIGQVRIITGNTTTSITVATDFDSDIEQGDSYFVAKGAVPTQYRYYKDADSDGNDHQMKMVLGDDDIQAIIDDNGTISEARDILDKADSFTVTGSDAVEDYASRSFTYYASDLDTDSAVSTPWGGSDELDVKYGGANLDETGFVRAKTTLGIRRTYFYMDLHGGPYADLRPNPNRVIRLVVEDETDAEGKGPCRRIHAFNKDAFELRMLEAYDKAYCARIFPGLEPSLRDALLRRHMRSRYSPTVNELAPKPEPETRRGMVIGDIRPVDDVRLPWDFDNDADVRKFLDPSPETGNGD